MDDETFSVDGLDVSRVLRLEVQGYGFLFDRAGPLSCYQHFGGASFHAAPEGSEGERFVENMIKQALDHWGKFK